ncbi:hypothetical protein DUNSADRAFT_18173, partial [Dunaliella salina]
MKRGLQAPVSKAGVTKKPEQAPKQDPCTLHDLCPEDKQKVARLLKQVVELGQENRALKEAQAHGGPLQPGSSKTAAQNAGGDVKTQQTDRGSNSAASSSSPGHLAAAGHAHSLTEHESSTPSHLAASDPARQTEPRSQQQGLHRQAGPAEPAGLADAHTTTAHSPNAHTANVHTANTHIANPHTGAKTLPVLQADTSRTAAPLGVANGGMESGDAIAAVN